MSASKEPENHMPWFKAIEAVGRSKFGWSGAESAEQYSEYTREHRRRHWNAAYTEALAKVGGAQATKLRASQFSGMISESAGDAELRRVLGVERYAAIGDSAAAELETDGIDPQAAARWNAARSWLVGKVSSGEIAALVQRGTLLHGVALPVSYWGSNAAVRASMTGEVEGDPSGPLLVVASDLERLLGPGPAEHSIAAKKRQSSSSSIEKDATIRNRIATVLALAKRCNISPTAKDKAGPLAKELARKQSEHGYGKESIRKILTGRLTQQRRLGIPGYFKK